MKVYYKIQIIHRKIVQKISLPHKYCWSATKFPLGSMINHIIVNTEATLTWYQINCPWHPMAHMHREYPIRHSSHKGKAYVSKDLTIHTMEICHIKFVPIMYHILQVRP